MRTRGRVVAERHVERTRDERVGGDVLDEVVGAEDDPAPLVVEDRVRRGVAGPVVDAQRTVAQLERRAVGERLRDGRRGAERSVGV